MKLDREALRKSLLLYAVTDRKWLNCRQGRRGSTLEADTERAILGGATFVQLREKHLGDAEMLREAEVLQALCSRHNVPFVVNDNVDIAVRMGADGVHVGQEDMEAGLTRSAIGADRILGVSVQTVGQAVLAEERGADYLGVGAVFPTGSKDDAAEVSFDTLRDICSAVNIPVVAIGGISADNVMELSGSGICGIAVISAIFAKEDIMAAAAELHELTLKMISQ